MSNRVLEFAGKTASQAQSLAARASDHAKEAHEKASAKLKQATHRIVQEIRAGSPKALKRTSPRNLEEEAEREEAEYAGPLKALLKDVCDSAGFAFGEVWIRPRRIVPEQEGIRVQWEFVMRYSGQYYINPVKFAEARNIQGVLDSFLKIAQDVRYVKGQGIPGLAWARGDTNWQNLSAYEVLDEQLQADGRSEVMMKMFDASVAVPVRHPHLSKVMAVMVFYRHRGESQEAMPAMLDPTKNENLKRLLDHACLVAPKAVDYHDLLPQWKNAQHAWAEALMEETGSDLQRDEEEVDEDFNMYSFTDSRYTLFLRRQGAQVTAAFMNMKQQFESRSRTLTAVEAEWAKGKFASQFTAYLGKFKGTGGAPPAKTDRNYCMWTFLGSFLAIVSMTYLDYRVGFYMHNEYPLYALVPSFSAVALILFSTPTSPFGQPRNVRDLRMAGEGLPLT